MTEYIDREMVLRKMQKVAVDAWKMKITAKVETVWNEAQDIVRAIPAADVRPVVLCRWCVLHGKCSTEDVFEFSGLSDDNRFCGVGKGLSNCGAKMDLPGEV